MRTQVSVKSYRTIFLVQAMAILRKYVFKGPMTLEFTSTLLKKHNTPLGARYAHKHPLGA